MPLIPKPNYNQIFASQSPEQDKPAVFNNYPEGWGPESRPNNGKPTIKGFNYLQQTSDLKDLWILQNGACLPYDESIEYADGAPVLKDGVIQYKTASGFVNALKTHNSLDGRDADDAHPASAILDSSGLSQQEINDLLFKSKDEYVNIFDFCKCDGTDESTDAILAVNRANSRRIPLYIPPNAELFISPSTTLEPLYGIFGGGRIRRPLGAWTAPALRLNFYKQFARDITFIKHDVPYDDIANVSVVDSTGNIGFIETTKNADLYVIEGCTIRGGKFGILPYGGSRGLIFKNDIEKQEQAGIHVGVGGLFTHDTTIEGVADGLVIAMNRINNISNAPLSGSVEQGDGIKLTAKCKNVIITDNDIRNCYRDAIDAFASGESILIRGNNLAYSGVKGIDIKADYASYPEDGWGRNQQIIIEGNNIFENEDYGVAVSNTNGIVYMVSIHGNNVYRNKTGGIQARGESINIEGNMVYANALGNRSYGSGIFVEGAAAKPTSKLRVVSNLCYNNGNPTIANNCGICIFDTNEDIDVHGNRCYNVTDSGIENPNQNYGIYVAAGGKNISILNNKSAGHNLAQIGWATGAEIIGEVVTVYIGTVADETIAPFGQFSSDYGITSITVQSADFAANSANYYSFIGRLANQSGGFALVDGGSFTTQTNALNLWGHKLKIKANSQLKTQAPMIRVLKTGTPVPLSSVSVSMSFVTW